MKIYSYITYGIKLVYVLATLWYYLRDDKKKELIFADAKRICKVEGRNFNGYQTIARLLLNSSTHFRDIFYWRLRSRCFFYRRFFKRYSSLFLDKDMEAEGGAFYFYHPFSTIIGASYVGYGCTFRNNTTVGIKVKNGKIERAVLEGNLEVGPNTCIIGGITIGKNVIVGAGSVVVKDVSGNQIVAGNPATKKRDITEQDLIDYRSYL